MSEYYENMIGCVAVDNTTVEQRRSIGKKFLKNAIKCYPTRSLFTVTEWNEIKYPDCASTCNTLAPL